MAWIAARWAASRTAAHVWAPAAMLFIFAAADPVRSGSRSGLSMGRWAYFANTMFGPDCHDSECLYTIFAAVLSGAATDSLVGWTIWRRRSKRIVPA